MADLRLRPSRASVRAVLAVRAVRAAAGAALIALAMLATGCSTGEGAPAAAAKAPMQPRPADPVALRIPSLGVDTTLVRLGIDESGELEAPEDPHVAGWFAEGPSPGEVGPAVIAGHVDSTDGPAVFYHLAQLASGDRITVERADGTELVFRVRAVETHQKDRFPSTQVYGPTPERALRLITCGGSFDREERHYHDNIIVFAVREG